LKDVLLGSIYNQENQLQGTAFRFDELTTPFPDDAIEFQTGHMSEPSTLQNVGAHLRAAIGFKELSSSEDFRAILAAQHSNGDFTALTLPFMVATEAELRTISGYKPFDHKVLESITLQEPKDYPLLIWAIMAPESEPTPILESALNT
jgi:hypothetical protein